MSTKALEKPTPGHEWELINNQGWTQTHRMWTFGGWIVRAYINVDEEMMSITFVPDPLHQWTLYPNQESVDERNK